MFCPRDKALLHITYTNGSLQKKCKNCNQFFPIKDTDTLLYEQHIQVNNTTNISKKLLKNIANDDIGIIIDKACDQCKRPYTKLFISDDLETWFILCPCKFDNKLTGTNT
jgi:DNA-directed RNA polymerase subunit M/transcription elongation factor TFIIS